MYKRKIKYFYILLCIIKYKMSNLLIEPTSTRDTFLAQEALVALSADTVNGFEVVLSASVQGGVGKNSDGTAVEPMFSSGQDYSTVSGDVNLFKAKGALGKLEWIAAVVPGSDSDGNNYLDNRYKVTFTEPRSDAFYQVFITSQTGSENTQGYTVVPRVTDKTVDGFEYQMHYAPDGSSPSTATPTTIEATLPGQTQPVDIDILQITQVASGNFKGSIPVRSVQFEHDILIMDF